jgi:hypothetical protein
MAEAQEQDEAIGPAALIADEKPSKKEARTWPKESKRYLTDWQRLVLKDGVLWRKWFKNRGQEIGLQFVTPRIMRREVLTFAHDNRLAATWEMLGLWNDCGSGITGLGCGTT